jgi:hypothetical protein
LAEERRSQRDLEAQVEEFALRIAEVVNDAGPEHRHGLREYAIELLKEETERGDAARVLPRSKKDGGSNPIGIALLLAMVGGLFLILFWPIGLVMLAMAAVMGTWGLVATLARR